MNSINYFSKKAILITIWTILSMAGSIVLQAQSPQKMSYQSVIRNANSELIQNTAIGIRIQILQDSEFGAAVYVETFSATTNENGLLSLEIGTGTVVYGNFSNINWGTGLYFIKSEIDLNNGTNYTISGTSQLLSVPYAFYANESGNSGNNYSAGTGISITNNIINNTMPDQVVTLTGNGSTTITGNYPSFTISSNDNNTTYSAGTGLSLSGTTFNSTWTQTNNNISNNNSANVGIGLTSPAKKFHVNGSFAIGTSSNYTSFQLGSQSASINYTLPVSQGLTNSLLFNDGAGNLFWQTLPQYVGGSGTINYLPLWTPNEFSLGTSFIGQSVNSVFINTLMFNNPALSVYPNSEECPWSIAASN